MSNIQFCIKHSFAFVLASFILFAVTNSYGNPLQLTVEANCISTSPVVSWVNNLNVRAAAKTSAKVVTTVQPRDLLEPTGRKSDFKAAIVLRGGIYYDYWIEVTTPKGIRGWVFGGAVKKPNEKKGNGVITDLKFDFPGFGAFDLSTWIYKGIKDSSGGDVTSESKIYEHPSHPRTMIVTRGQSEYNKYTEHKLLGMNDRPIKTRRFYHSYDIDELEVEIITHNVSPKRRAIRKQDVSAYGIRGGLSIVVGEWEYSEVE